MAKLETFKLNVVGEQSIHCHSCENAIQRGLAQLSGVRTVKADHAVQTVEVEVDTAQADLDAVQQRLDWMGYQTEPESSA